MFQVPPNNNEVSDQVRKLTVRDQKLYYRCKYLLKNVRKLRNTIKAKKQTNILKTLYNDENVTELLQKDVGPSLALMLQSTIQNGKRRLKGRRWTQPQKFLALEIYKKSPRTYRLLSRLFCLPSVSTLKNLLNRVELKTGINENMFASLANMAKKHSNTDNLCTLIFDEMAIRKHLSYNSKTDNIDGYQDHGLQGRTTQIASHALVFMVAGIRKKWKQLVAFYFSGDSVTADRLSVLLKEVISIIFYFSTNIFCRSYTGRNERV